MLPSPPRRLNLVDGMLLVVGAALSLVLTRQYLRDSWPDFANRVGSTPTRLIHLNWYIGEIARVAMMWLAMYSPVLLVIRLRHPRPGLVRLSRQPGSIASLAGTIFVIVGGLLWGILVMLENLDPSGKGPFGLKVNFRFYELTFGRMLSHVGSAIALIWIWSALMHQWRSERGSIDRLGRLLGIGWIITCMGIMWADIHQGLLSARMSVEMQPFIEEDEKTSEARHKAIVEDGRQTFRLAHVRLEELMNSGDQNRMKEYIKQLIENNDWQSQQFEQQEKERSSGMADPFEPDVPRLPTLKPPLPQSQ